VSIRGYKLWNIADRKIVGSVLFPLDIWQQVREQTPGIEKMALCEGRDATISGDTAPEIVTAAYISGDFFLVMGARPIAGRPILPSDVQPGAKPVAVASYALFRSLWGGNTAALGHTVVLDGSPYTLVGAMPPGFDFGLNGRADGMWVPNVAAGKRTGELSESSAAVARLRKGATPQTLNSKLQTISPRFSKDFSKFGGGGYFQCSSLVPHFYDLDHSLMILLGAVGLVLLIACANVGGLLLSRGWSRQREIAIREAVGASRARIVRQLLTENLLLALAGGALGLLLSMWCVYALRVITPATAPEHGKFLLSMNILWFTLAVSLLTGVLFGLAPAFQASSRQIGFGLRKSFAGSLAGCSARRPAKLRSAMVILEVALAVVLVAGATLLARSLEKLVSVELGFRTDHIVAMTANFSKSACDPGNSRNFSSCWLMTREVLKRIRAISGVQSAAAAPAAPLAGWSVLLQLHIEGQSREISLNSGTLAASRSISSHYFRTLGIRLLSGRGFTDADVNGSQPVAVVNVTFAMKYLDGKPIGKRIGTEKRGSSQWIQIVGEVSDTQDATLNGKPLAEVFTPAGQGSYFTATTFIARASANPKALMPSLEQAIWSADKNAPITDVKTMDQIVSEAAAQPRFRALLLGSFGVLGLALALVGIYGVISHGVVQRTREIGIRVALGAQNRNVLRLIVWQGTKLVLAGLAIGLVAALAATRLMRSLLYGVSATDPLTFAGVSILLVLAGLAACYLPARRAMRVDPMTALRHE
jgi:predicted permease